MHHLAAFTLLFAAPAFAQLSAPTPTPPLPPTPLRSQPRIMQLRMPRAEPGSDLNIIPSGTWWRYPETIKDISLSPDQQHKMDDIFRQNRIQLIDLKASLEKEQLNLEPILNGNPPDTGKAYAEIAHIADLRADLEKANAKMLLGLRALLTADQWTKLQAHRPGVSISTDEGQNWQSLSSMKDLSTSTTCNAMFNNSGKDCTITTVSTKRENGHTVVTTCISTAAQSTPKCTTSPSGSSQSFFLTLPWNAITPPPASFRMEIPDGLPGSLPNLDPLP